MRDPGRADRRRRHFAGRHPRPATRMGVAPVRRQAARSSERQDSAVWIDVSDTRHHLSPTHWTGLKEEVDRRERPYRVAPGALSNRDRGGNASARPRASGSRTSAQSARTASQLSLKRPGSGSPQSQPAGSSAVPALLRGDHQFTGLKNEKHVAVHVPGPVEDERGALQLLEANRAPGAAVVRADPGCRPS